MSFRIRVATYNIHKCKGIDQRTSPERIAAVIKKLDADVIALQEILDVQSGRPELDQVRRIQSELRDYQPCFGENRQLHGGGYGNLTLSRLHVLICENYDVTWRHRERRGCLRTDIQLPDRSILHLFNLHLGTGFTERRHQAKRLLSDEVLNRGDCGGPRVVVGDFNEWTKGLASHLMGTVFEVARPKTLLRRSYPGVFPVLHLDHFYYDKQLKLKSFHVHRNRTALVASDHLPIVAEFAGPAEHAR